MYSLFSPILKVFGFLLAQIYSVIPNLGVAIIILTILIMLLLYPLTSKQTRSMMAMQRVQPEIKKLQAKYKGDRQKLNEEMMKFYQENKINPLSGCLPLLVQMPILISLFGVLRKAYDYVPKSSKLYNAFCHGFGAVPKTGDPKFPACGTILKASQLDNPIVPKGLVKGEGLLHHLHFLGLDLQRSASSHHDGFGDAFPYFFLVALVIISYVASSRQAAKRTPAANKQMGAVMKILPPFFGLISVGLPSGLVLYLFVSSIFRVGQQEIIFRRHGHLRHGPVKGAIDVKSKDKAPPPKGQSAPPPPAEVESSEPTPKAQPKPAGRQAPVQPAQPAERARGLRGAFALPPPPGGNGESLGSERPSTAGTGGGDASQRRRRNKKKRKR